MAVATPHHREPLMRERVVRAGLAALLVATMTASVGAGPAPAEAGIAPACSFGDVPTRYRAQGDWYRSLLDTRYRLSSTFTPADLVAANRSGAAGYGYVRRIVLPDLTAMYRAAKAAGAPFAIESAYRSYSSQVSTFAMWVRKQGYATAALASARPGHSEHQLGTTLDLKTPGGAQPWSYPDWGTTKAGSWLARNSWRYGWVMSYPKAKSPSATCYKYEPWHFRYVGRSIAAAIHASKLAPREWLYLKGATTSWTGGPPSPTPSPSPTASPSTSPTGSPNPTESPSASPADSPSDSPSDSPTTPPTEPPTASPTDSPAAAPATAPTASVTPSDVPTESPVTPAEATASPPPSASPEAVGESPAP